MEKNRRILVIGPDDGGIYDALLICHEHQTESIEKDDQDRENDFRTAYEVFRVGDEIQAMDMVKTSALNHKPYALIFLTIQGVFSKEYDEFFRQICQTDPLVKVVIAADFTEESRALPFDNYLFYLKAPFESFELIQLADLLIREWNLEKKIALQKENLQTANKKMADMNRTLMKKVERQTAMIVQAEKMASVGILAAGVAHEINNPISYVNSNLFTIKKYFSRIKGLYDEYQATESFLKNLTDKAANQILEKIHAFKAENKIQMIMEDLITIAEDSIDGIDRVKTIVSNLKTFSRTDEEEYKSIDINQAIQTALNIIWNEIRYKVEVEKDFQDLPLVKCFPQKISQVFMNILINAAQAIEDKGKIFITTRMVARGRRQEDQFIQIRISDTGSGIPKEELGKIFDPFFTTKPVGQGTGLGLSIVYEIVKAHGGRIDVVSKLGKGTRFTLHLPAAHRISPISG